MTQRTPWADVDARLRASVEGLLGARVVGAQSQPGGFSPGSADRLVLEDGRRVFVKTGSDAVNPDVVRIHRNEATATASLARDLPVPALLGVVDDGDRIALVLEDVEGRHPATPWRPDELAALLDALAVLSARPADPALPDLAAAAGHYAQGWERLGDAVLDLPADLVSWVRDRRAELERIAARMPDAVRGDRLVHHDVRADNILIRPDGAIVLVDWPWASRGAPWVDALTLLFEVRSHDPGADVEALIRRHAVFEDMDAADADAVLVALAGYFTWMAGEPAPPGIPTLRRFQRHQAVAILRWLRERLD